MMQRRDFLTACLAGGVSLAFGGWCGTASAAAERSRFVLIILRGGLDGLYAVPAVGDPSFADARGALAAYAQTPPSLDATFALHPLLPGMHALYRSKQLLVLHACAIPYAQRSHFDAQNVLETGGTAPFQLSDGWLNRTLAAMQSTGSALGIALSPSIPAVLQGAAPVTNWSGDARMVQPPAPDLLARMARLYADDSALASALSEGVSSAQMLAEGDGRPAGSAGMAGGTPPGKLSAVARQAAVFLAAPAGPSVAVIQAGGWDTHTNQVRQLQSSLSGLDQGLGELRSGLGEAWQRTVVVIATEFGRMVRTNGGGGTDHGVGMAAFVAGGAVAGGRVIADWPGLAAGSLYEGRDLKPTADLRSALKGLLGGHFKLPRAVLDTRVFPDSSSVASLRDLLA